MNRALRRKLQREDQRERTVKMTPAERHEMIQKITDKVLGFSWERIIPIFLMYLVDHYGCKEKGLERFMDWFNAMQAWIDEDPDRLDAVAKDLYDKTGVEIKW